MFGLKKKADNYRRNKNVARTRATDKLKARPKYVKLSPVD